MMFAYTLVICAGFAASAVTATDHSWIKWHFSQLGEGPGRSALIFNATLILSGIPLWLYARRITEVIRAKYRTADFTSRLKYFRGYIYLIAIATAGVGLFPRDQNLFIHDLFGHAIFIFYLAVIIGSAVTPRFLPRYIRLYSVAGAALTTAMWAIHSGFEGNIISMTQIEVVGASLVFVWMWMFTNHVTDK